MIKGEVIMGEVIVEIRGNKFSEIDIDNMLIDFIMLGENVYYKNQKNIEKQVKAFVKKYKRDGMNIITKKRHLKQLLNSAKLIYQLTGFYSYKNTYDKYVYTLNQNLKGSKVYLHLKDEKELVVIYNSISSFLESWFIHRRWEDLVK